MCLTKENMAVLLLQTRFVSSKGIDSVTKHLYVSKHLYLSKHEYIVFKQAT